MKLSELVARSGDSEFVGLRYDGAVLEIDLNLGEDEETIRVRIPTDYVRTNLPANQNHLLMGCRIEFDDLIDVAVCNGYYVPASEFVGVMKEVRSGRSLAYGTKVDDHCGVFSVVGYSRLVCCLVRVDGVSVARGVRKP